MFFSSCDEFLSLRYFVSVTPLRFFRAAPEMNDGGSVPVTVLHTAAAEGII